MASDKLKLLPSVLLLLSCFASPYLMANSAEESLEHAADAYYEGKFQEAAALYQAVIEEQGWENASLFLNLGNSFYKSGERGKALAAYFRAFALNPRDAGVLQNIQMALAANRDAIEWVWPEPSWVKYFSLYGYVSKKELVYLTGFAIMFCGVIFGIWALRRDSGNGLKIVAISFAVLGLYGIVASILQHKLWPHWGAVSAETAKIYSSPSERSGLVLFELSEGAPVIVKEHRDGWRRIQISDRKQGWIAMDQLGFLDVDFE